MLPSVSDHPWIVASPHTDHEKRVVMATTWGNTVKVFWLLMYNGINCSFS